MLEVGALLFGLFFRLLTHFGVLGSARRDPGEGRASTDTASGKDQARGTPPSQPLHPASPQHPTGPNPIFGASETALKTPSAELGKAAPNLFKLIPNKPTYFWGAKEPPAMGGTPTFAA